MKYSECKRLHIYMKRFWVCERKYNEQACKNGTSKKKIGRLGNGDYEKEEEEKKKLTDNINLVNK